MLRLAMVLLVLLAGASQTLAQSADREAERAYRQGQRLQRAGKLREALEAFEQAAARQPRDARFLLARELTRQRAAFQRVNLGVRLAEQKHYAEAVREFEQAQEIDPSNEFTSQELAAARQALEAEQAARAAGPPVAPSAAAADGSGLTTLELHPQPVVRSWNLRGDAQALYLALGAAYGIHFDFDEGLPTARVRLQLQDAGFSTAVTVLSTLTKTFVAPLSETSAIVTSDNPQKRVQFERMVLKNLPVAESAALEEVTEIANALRSVLEMRFVQPNARPKFITVRDTPARVRAAEELVRSASLPRPEVMLELETLEVHRDFVRELGLLVNAQTALFKVSPLGDKVQSGVAVPLPQVFGRARAVAGAAMKQPLAGFGGGRSQFGITLPGAQFRASLSQSLVRGISRLTVRASNNQTAVFLVGSRYPIVNASFSPILFSSAIQQQQQQGTLINPFPSFTFEDLGIKVRITPRIHPGGEISLKVEAQVRALTGQNLNGVPTISNRETEQIVRVRDGHPTLISGLVGSDERSSLSGMPFLAERPVLGYLFGLHTKETAETELIMVLTPHVLRAPPAPESGPRLVVPTNYVPVSK